MRLIHAGCLCSRVEVVLETAPATSEEGFAMISGWSIHQQVREEYWDRNSPGFFPMKQDSAQCEWIPECRRPPPAGSQYRLPRPDCRAKDRAHHDLQPLGAVHKPTILPARE